MRLQTRLALAQVPLVVGLAVIGFVAGATIARLGRSSQEILKDNYRSVLAAQRMKESIERIDSAAMFLVAGRRDKGLAQAAPNQRRLEDELVVAEHNITEPGEAAAMARLRARWREYQAKLARFEALPDGPEQGRVYFAEMEPAFLAVKDAADEVLAINEDGMLLRSDRAARVAHRFDALILVATAAAVALGLLAAVGFTRRLLRPLSVLTQAVRRVGQGDLEARAQLPGGDEIAQVAREFNTMADRLAQYRSSSLGELLQAQQSAQAAIDSLPDPVVMLDAAGAVLAANEAAAMLLHIGDEGIAGAEPIVGETIERVRAHVAAGRGPWVPRGLDEAFRLPLAGGERWLLPRATPLYGEGGALGGVTIVFEDVTRLRRFDELKNDLVATVAHEFRTPLTSLRMAIHLCAEETVGPLTPKQADLLFAARGDCERLQEMVDDLLDLSRIQSGGMELARRRLSLGPFVEELVKERAGRAEEQGVELVAVIAPGLDDVHADPERLQLVFENLLANALRHTPSGGRIEVRALPGDGEVRVEVADTGPGIPLEYREAIFERFFRVPGSPPGGVGLGLYICREVVRAHGGQIGVESEPGRGATFWFTLPASDEGRT